MKLMYQRMFTVIAAVLIIALAASCAGPEQKRAKFFKRGTELYDKGEYAKAKVEFKNAIQIDVKYADAYYMLGMITLKLKNPRGAHGSFVRAVELDPRHWDAQLQMGWFLLGSGDIPSALGKVDLVLKEKPGHEDALLLKGAILLKKKDLVGAQRHLEAVLGREVHKPEGYLLLTSIYAEQSDMTNVERVLRDGIKDNPRAISLHLGLVDLYVKKKRMDEAIQQMRTVVELEPNVQEHHLNLAAICWLAGREQQAKEVLASYIQTDPEQDDRWIQAARFYMLRNRPGDGEEQLRAGIRRNEKSFPIRFALSAHYLASNRPDEGFAVLQECLKLERNPSDPNILHTKNTLARYHLARQEMDRAKQYVDEVIKESPKNIDANYLAGTIHLRRLEAPQAVSSFRTVINERQEFLPGYVGLADAHLLQKEHTLAFDAIQKALKIAPNDREVLRAKARVHGAQKDLQSAEALYRKLLAADPGDLDVRADLGDLLLQAGEMRRAESEYVELKRRAPDNPAAYLKLSALYGAQKKWDKAIGELELAVKVRPDNASMANDLAYLLSEYGSGARDLDRAHALAEKARSLNPGNPNILDTLGWIKYRKGDVQQAAALLTQANEKSPENPVINYHLGMVYSKMGEQAKTKQHLQLALGSKTAFPGRDEAEKTLAAVRQ